MAKILTDIAIRNLIPHAKDYKVADSLGLFLLVRSNGGKLWRFKYRFAGKEKQLAFGSYPERSLAEAREERDAARKLLLNGIDPSFHKKQEKAKTEMAAANTFAAIAEDLYRRKIKEGKAPRTLEKVRWLIDIANKSLGQHPISEIQPFEIMAILKKYEEQGYTDTLKRLRTLIGQVFRFAVQTARANNDPTWALKGAVFIPKPRHHSAITDPKEFGALLRAIDGYPPPVVRSAMQLLALCFQRPGELRAACWREFDLEQAIWDIPAERMKMRRPHRVPLPKQAIAVLEKLKDHTGDSELVFPSNRGRGRPMSENTMNAALRRLGYDKGEVVSHGFRTTASTLLNESGYFSPDAIESALSHIDRNEIRRTYNHAQFWPERVRMAQWWADFCDALKTGDSIKLEGKVVQLTDRRWQEPTGEMSKTHCA